jgi:hypothetical protein
MLPPGEDLDFYVLPTGLDWSLVYSSGASSGLSDGDPDSYTPCDGDSDDDVTFSFHTGLVCGFDLGGVGSSFTGSSNSSLSFHKG